MRNVIEMSGEELLQYNHEVFEKLLKTSEANFNAQNRYKVLKQHWDDALAKALAEGTIVGKNDAERTGNAILMAPERYSQLLGAQEDARVKEFAWQSARTELDYLASSLRIMELSLPKLS